MPSNVQMLYIETNENEYPSKSLFGDTITRVYIKLDNLSDMIEYVKRVCDNPEWLPDKNIVLNAGAGAGGMRSCGRLALWGRHQQGDNFMAVFAAISQAYAEAFRGVGSGQERGGPGVFITGSLSGGTGSGTFIDVAYIVRHIIPNIKSLYGLFLLPQQPKNQIGEEVKLGNTYGALKDLEYFNRDDTVYSEKWPNGFQKSYSEPPYELVQFISRDYSDGSPAISSLKGLVKMAGMYLFLNIAGIYEKRNERLVDGSSNELIGKYGTFGLSAIQFPKHLIREQLANLLSIDLIERLTDKGRYYEGGHPRGIDTVAINRLAAEAWDKILTGAFRKLDAINYNGDLVVSFLAKEAIMINRGDIADDPESHIKALFSSQHRNIYAAIQNNYKLIALSDIVDGLEEEVERVLQRTESLNYTLNFLDGLAKAITDTINYWERIRMSSHPNNWDNELHKLATAATTNMYQPVFQQDAVLKDRLLTILEMLKIHHSIRPLIDLREHILVGGDKFVGGQRELPRRSFILQIIRHLISLKDSDKSDVADYQAISGHPVSFADRIDEIKAEIFDTTIPIERVYPSESFETEVEKARAGFFQANGHVRSMNEVTEQVSLWSYFKEKDNHTFNREMYRDIQSGYSRRVQEGDSISDYNVSEYVKRHTSAGIVMARKAITPFLKVNRTFNTNASIPRFIVGSEESVIKEVIHNFKMSNTRFDYFEDSNDHICPVSALKNTLFFYDEKAGFDIISWLDYINLLKESYERIPRNSQDSTMTEARWINGRNAYVKRHLS